jgi:MIF4G domain
VEKPHHARNSRGTNRTQSNSSLRSQNSNHKSTTIGTAATNANTAQPPVPPQRTISHRKLNSNTGGGGGGRGNGNGGRGGSNGRTERSKSFSVHSNHNNASHLNASSTHKKNNSQVSSSLQQAALSLAPNSHEKTNAATSLSSTNSPRKTNARAPKRAHSYAGHGALSQNNSQHNASSPYTPRTLDEIVLLTITGAGTTLVEQSIRRYSSDALLSQRLLHLDAPPIKATTTMAIGTTATTATTTKSSKSKSQKQSQSIPQQQNADESKNAQDNLLYWTPHDRCVWTDPDRVRHIAQEQTLYYNFTPLQVNDATRWKARKLRTSSTHAASSSTASAAGATASTIDEQHRATAEAAVLAILNKLSWTNLDKLTLQFVQALSTVSTTTASSDNGPVANVEQQPHSHSSTSISQELMAVTMALVVDKAMLEPHFAALYARLSVNLANIHKQFKRTVLKLCQEQFEATKTLDKPISDNATSSTLAASSVLARKKSIGLVIFIGELYVMGLIKANIMISCCERLLVPTDEEQLESFCKLMTTIGKRFHQELGHSPSSSLSSTVSDSPDNGTTSSLAATTNKLWNVVYRMAGKELPTQLGQNDSTSTETMAQAVEISAPSTRIKFLLQALIELKENDWIQVRHEHEKAKTIAQIHAQVAEEAKRGPITKTTSAVLKRSQSGGALIPAVPAARGQQRSQSPKTNRWSAAGMPTTDHGVGSAAAPMSLPAKPKRDRTSLRRAKSEVSASAMAIVRQQQLLQQKRNSGNIPSDSIDEMTATTTTTAQQLETLVVQTESRATNGTIPAIPPSSPGKRANKVGMDADACAAQTKTILKEYFVSGDRGEAVALIDQIVGMNGSGNAASVARGVAVVSAGILQVMEMKQVQVRKFLEVVSKCLDDQKLDKASLIPALSDPLEFLRDIEIDAPLAGTLLATIVADWLKKKVDDGATAIDSLERLLAHAPATFLQEGRPAHFVAMVLQHRGGEVSEADLAVLENLLSATERNEYPCAMDYLQSLQ